MLPFSKCPMCGGELVEQRVEKRLQGTASETTLDVDAEVCLTCGERLYSPETVRRFEQVRMSLV
ncbi:MAG TPA: YgiT-type zinc finger protein [Thermoanaerobaculia bacterium]